MDRKKRRFIMRVSILSILAVAVGYVFYSNFFQAEATSISEGEEAPNFALHNMEGERVELADYEGQGVFLNFWGTFCPPCEREMPYMENQYQAYQDEGVEILAVNVGESRLTIDRFVDRHNLTFPVLMDEGEDVKDHYGIRPLPTTFLINEDQEVERIITGGMTEDHIEGYMEEIKPSQ
ncbi:peroxiredoxin [Salsuginibacillus halophilus]|uniref:Peroxiredoxin n=1 Tax=Salsuginibacillus halophilus TaxID=517424 RepID=A0A2P8HXX2_9BACI|nr:thiol-disulfide oxidoreductase ResA [Salsuginibacillus halophilus]PSL50995.1 peroxiredoxin [Salsuginibacillus halophilus]